MSSLSSLACGIAGFLYPAFRSFKAIRDDGCADGVQCAPHPSSPSVRLPHTAFLATGLTYWVTFALFRCVESLLDFFIGWLPLYYELKLVFVIWLMAPYPIQGSKFLFLKFLKPALDQYEFSIDKQIAAALEPIMVRAR